MELETTGGDRSSEVWEKAGIPDDLRPLNPELISQGAEAVPAPPQMHFSHPDLLFTCLFIYSSIHLFIHLFIYSLL